MLNDLLELKKKRDQQKAQNAYKKALNALENHQEKQVILILDKAIQYDKAYTLACLEKSFHQYFKEETYDRAACLGYVLLQHCPKNFRLANKIGNCERKMGHHKEANAMYRHALKINKSFDWAIHNMAASMAKVGVYDGNIASLIKTYIKFDSLLMPDINYFEVPRNMDTLFLKFKHAEYCEKVNEMQSSILSHGEHDSEAAERKFSITAKMMKNKYLREAENLTYREKSDQICAKVAHQDWSIYTDTERTTLSWEIYNFVVQTLSPHKLYLKKKSIDNDFVQSDPFKLMKALLLKLIEEGIALKYLDMLLAIIYFLEGNKTQATDILKSLLSNYKENRFYNVNLGLIYYYSENRLMSFKHLVKGAVVLKDLEGYYLLSDIILLAQRKQVEKDYEKALTLYKIVAKETDDVRYLKNIGHILIELERYNEAIEVFLEIRKLVPKSKTVHQQLEKLIHILRRIGDDAIQENQLQTALDSFLTVLKIKRSMPEILRKAAAIYKKMGNQSEAYNLTKEREVLIVKLQEHQKEKERLTLIEKGKLFIKHKKFNDGIQCLNDAMLLKPDRKLYAYLSNLYIKLNFKKALLKLEDRWSKVNLDAPINP